VFIMLHRKTIRHFHEPGHLHELTFSCFRRMPLLTNDPWRRLLAQCLDAAVKETQVLLVAFVFMPEHVHLLVYPAASPHSISYLLARVKQPFSKQAHSLLVDSDGRLLERLMVKERPGKTCFRFWQEGPGFDRNLHSPDAIVASLDYLHTNPVKRGLCRQAIDWRWSSARFYLAEPPAQQYEGLPRVHGLPVGALS
jgi:putative transposase